MITSSSRNWDTTYFPRGTAIQPGHLGGILRCNPLQRAAQVVIVQVEVGESEIRRQRFTLDDNGMTCVCKKRDETSMILCLCVPIYVYVSV